MDKGETIEGIAAETRILIVEDDPVSALLLRKILEHRSYIVDHAENGSQALEMFSEAHHRIVISDWMMPEMDGVSLCREIRSRGGPYVYVILLSAKGQRADRLEAFEAGVDDFLTKPLDREDLFARLKAGERVIGTEERLQKQNEEIAHAKEKLVAANANLVVASRRFEELFSGMPMACFTFDSSGCIHEWNRSAEKLFGVAAHESLLNIVFNVFEDKADGFWTPDLIETVFRGKTLEGSEWVFRAGPDDLRHIVCNIFPLRSPNGDILGAISANLDITERKKAQKQIEEQKAALEEANERLSRLAVTDGLTGLWNHRRFQEELDACFTQHQKAGKELSLLILDVDNFKQYNDRFGHQAGDQVLKQVADTLLGAATESEFVARYGGEEFTIILSGCDMDGALLAAEKFRLAISEAEWQLRAVTASIGAGTIWDERDTPAALIRRADQALYASKQAGRNKVTHARDLDPAKSGWAA